MATDLLVRGGLRIAVEGCGHGTLHSIYASVAKACEAKAWPGVDLLIIGGDFQAVRNAYDLNCMSVPKKYREIGDFHEYYSGQRTAPYLTIFIAGNHEASNHLSELYYGGWAAPKIYYMGAANVLRLGPLRIAGLSGIWKGYNYNKPHHERLPYSFNDTKSAYHVREYDTRKLLQLRTQVDVGLSHDWPRGVEWMGNYKWLWRKKDQFEVDANNGQLGSVAAKYVLDRLRPSHWFSAHLHIKYPAIVDHKNGVANEASASAPSAPKEPEVEVSPQKNEDEIDLDMDDDAEIQQTEPKPAVDKSPSTAAQVNTDEIDLGLEDVETGPAAATSAQDTPAEVPGDLIAQLPASFAPHPEHPKPAGLPFPEDIKNETTKFLALDKCLPRRDFLQVLEIEPISVQPTDATYQRPLHLEYDKEWLAITRVFAKDFVFGDPDATVPRDQGEAHYRPLIEQEEAWVEENIVKPGKMTIPEDFVQTAPVYDAAFGPHVDGQPMEYTNPHTKTFCEMMQIPIPFDATAEERAERMARGPRKDEDAGAYRGRSGRGFAGGGGGRGRGRGRGGGGRGSRGKWRGGG
ncbi:lariat debranching enzyme [Diplodia corticola]|uniref:Lariat debranching enzyme n=1 Tax=Diplodia corticola TaxID=236234 RepID=A0A1J9R810_9PEZI|nr:lariat debranching enzyme [Diplodia corticola]OJD37686.1 lariat debranching enzyme [Diplodia corticola]